ncbi:MAG: conjugal transfer protein TrbD [Caulobacteraceae bacterium]
MDLRSVPIRRIGTRNSLLMGGDREIVIVGAMLAAVLIFPQVDNIVGWITGLSIWFAVLFAARRFAKADPLLRPIYMRGRHYPKYMAAHSRPWRENKKSQTWHYSSPTAKIR